MTMHNLCCLTSLNLDEVTNLSPSACSQLFRIRGRIRGKAWPRQNDATTQDKTRQDNTRKHRQEDNMARRQHGQDSRCWIFDLDELRKANNNKQKQTAKRLQLNPDVPPKEIKGRTTNN
jgi:hypothetical protein